MRNNRGFTLTELLIATGILSFGTLYFMNFVKQVSATEKRLVNDTEKLFLASTVSQVISNPESCTNTLGVGTVVQNGRVLSSLKNKRNLKVLEIDKKYGGSTMVIKSIGLENLKTNQDIELNKFGEVDLEVVFENVSKSALKKREKRVFPLKVALDQDNKLIECSHRTESARIKSKVNSCKKFGGIYDPVLKVCSLKDFENPPVAPYSLTDVVSTKYLEEYKDSILNSLFVNVDGDTMTGDLDSEASFCIDGNCRSNFETQVCPTGTVIKSVSANGKISCASVTCPDPTTFYIGTSEDGLAICKPFPTTTCSVNQYVDIVNDDGSVVCKNLPPGTNKSCLPNIISRIDEDGNHYCANAETLNSKQCPVNQVTTGIDSYGNVKCSVAIFPAKWGTCKWMGRKKAGEGDWGARYCPSGYQQKGSYFKTGVGTGSIKVEWTDSGFKAKHNGNWFTKDIEVDVYCCELTSEIP